VSVVANVAINVDSRNAVSKLRQVQTQSQQTERAVEGLSRAFGGLAAAFGAGFALTKVIADVKELDTNLRRLGTVGGNVAALDKGLGALSDRLDGVANKAELAAASYQALSAGFTETGANLRVVEAATKAAVGGLADITGVVDVTTKVLNSYNMSGDQAAKVTDSISKAVELGQVQWSDYTSQLGRVASIAAIAGVSLDEVNAFVAAATKNGATAEVAFTGLGASLATIIKPTKESAEAAQALGINWTLAGLRGEGFESLMNQLAKAMESNTEKATEMVGGQEAVRGAFAAASKGGKDYAMILEGLGGAAGKTDADFQTMKGSLENTLKALDTSFKNLSEALGTAFGPTVVIAVQDITKAVNGFADLMATVPQPVMNTAGELVKLIAQMLLLQKAIQAIIALRATFIGAMVGMTGATVASGTAATASAGAFALYTNNTRALQAQAATATPVLVGLRNVLSTIAAIGVITVAVNIAISGFQSLLAANAELDKLRGRKAAGGAAAMFTGSSKEEVSRQQAIARKTLKHEQATLQGLQSPGSRLAQFVNLGGVLEGLGVPSIQSAGRREMQAKARMGSAQAVLGLDANRFPSATPTPVANAMGTPVGSTVGGGGGRAAGGGGASKAENDAKRALEIQKQQYQAADDRNTALKDTFALLQQTEAVAKRELELDIRLGQIAREFNTLKEEAKSADELAMVSLNENLEKKIAELEAEREINELLIERATLVANLVKASSMPTVYNELETQDAALQAILDKYPAIGSAADAAATLATSGMAAMIDGTKSAQEVFADFLNTIANALMQTAAKMIAQYIAIGIARMFAGMGSSVPTDAGGWATSFATPQPGIGTGFNFDAGAMTGGMPWSFGGAMAKGGPVSSGQTYMVGERGPELFVPGRSGTIVANDKMGGGNTNVVVNVDAKGSSVEGDEQGANQLGRVISAAVQSELIKQQRPGGILAR
jgi:TP901 family phage tail tape measure protein